MNGGSAGWSTSGAQCSSAGNGVPEVEKSAPSKRGAESGGAAEWSVAFETGLPQSCTGDNEFDEEDNQQEQQQEIELCGSTEFTGGDNELTEEHAQQEQQQELELGKITEDI